MKTRLFNCKFFYQVLISISILFFLTPNTTAGKLEFPTKPVEITCGYSAGGITDTSLRVLAKASEKYLGQPIVVVNKPGGGTVIALHLTIDKKPDGYSLVNLSYSAAAITPHLREVRYDPVRDFTPIMQYGGNRYTLVVRADAPWGTFKELVEYSKKNPGAVSFGQTGWSCTVIALKRLAMGEGIKWKFVPFNSTREGVVACMGGHITASVGAGTEAPFVRAGKLKALASLRDKRSATANIPTLIELGYPYSAGTLCSIVGPKGIPEEIVEKLDNAFKNGMSDPRFIKVMEDLEQDILYRDHKALGEVLKIYATENADVKELIGLEKK